MGSDMSLGGGKVVLGVLSYGGRGVYWSCLIEDGGFFEGLLFF